MTVKHTNFYENLKEAQMRLRGTVVAYDGEPYYVLAITSHKPDGIFRVYLDPLTWSKDELDGRKHRNQPEYSQFPQDHAGLGKFMDDWMEKNTSSPVLRKMMNSPHFNKFRPFPLGMCNSGGKTYYLERQPARNREQGLTSQMISEHQISLGKDKSGRDYGMINVNLMSPEFRACVMAEHPSAKETLEKLRDPDIENESVAFHRDFALLRGPVDSLFLAYKSDVVGILPNADFSKIRLSKNFCHTREVVTELGIFDTIVTIV